MSFPIENINQNVKKISKQDLKIKIEQYNYIPFLLENRTRFTLICTKNFEKGK